MANVNNKSLSIFVNRGLPDFVESEYPRFHTFVKTFFEFAERQFDLTLAEEDQFQPGPYWLVENLLNSNDIDKTYDSYLTHIHNEIANDFPISVDGGTFTPYDVKQHRQFLKMMTDFHQSKGTAQSYSFFFRALFNAFFDFYLPKLDIVKCSDGKWTEPFLIRLINTNDTEITDIPTVYAGLLDSRIVGAESGASGYIDLVDSEWTYAPVSNFNHDKYSEAYIENEEIFETTVTHVAAVAISWTIHDTSAEVEADILVYLDNVLQEYTTEYVFASSTQIDFVTEPPIGSTLVVKSRTKSNESWLNVVSIKGAFKPGEVLNIYPIQSDGSESTSFISSYKIKNQTYDITDATYFIDPNMVGIGRPPGYWLNQDGWVSSNKYLQNSYYYQDFSYEIQTNLSLSAYIKPLSENLHTAGFLLFSKLGDEAITLPSPSSGLGLGDVCITPTICNEIASGFTNTVELNNWLIDSNTTRYGGLDWSTLDRYSTRDYSTFLSEMKDLDYADGGSNPLQPLDFRINDANNHAIVFLNHELRTSEWIDGYNNHQIWGQFIDFDTTVSGDLYIFDMDITRSTYNEYFHTEVEFSGTITLKQTVSSSNESEEILILNRTDSGTTLVSPDDYTWDGNVIDINTIEAGSNLEIVVLEDGELEVDSVSGEDANIIAFPTDGDIELMHNMLIFKDGEVLQTDEYEIDENLDRIFFNSFVSSSSTITLYKFKNI